jgi:hypothetical protein
MEVKYPKYAQEPQNYRDNDDPIENRLDVRLHRDEAIHQPQQKPNDDQGDNDVDQHTVLSLRQGRADRDRRRIPISDG